MQYGRPWDHEQFVDALMLEETGVLPTPRGRIVELGEGRAALRVPDGWDVEREAGVSARAWNPKARDWRMSIGYEENLGAGPHNTYFIDEIHRHATRHGAAVEYTPEVAFTLWGVPDGTRVKAVATVENLAVRIEASAPADASKDSPGWLRGRVVQAMRSLFLPDPRRYHERFSELFDSERRELLGCLNRARLAAGLPLDWPPREPELGPLQRVLDHLDAFAADPRDRQAILRGMGIHLGWLLRGRVPKMRAMAYRLDGARHHVLRRTDCSVIVFHENLVLKRLAAGEATDLRKLIEGLLFNARSLVEQERGRIDAFLGQSKVY